MAVLQPRFLQQRGYDAKDLRQSIFDSLSNQTEQVINGLQVTPAGSLTVSIAAGAAFVKGDSTPRQGMYHVENDSSLIKSITPNSSGSPRIDRVILRVYDAQEMGGSTNGAFIEVHAGTPTSGATLVNLNGAAALPDNAINLAYILRPSGDATIDAAEILDARPQNATTEFEIANIGNNPTLTATATSTLQKILFNASGIVYDSDLITGRNDWTFDDANDAVIFNTPGRYRVTCHMNWPASGQTGSRNLHLRRNGSGQFDPHGTSTVQNDGSGIGAYNHLCFVASFVANDSLTVHSQHGYGSSTAPYSARLHIQRVDRLPNA